MRILFLADLHGNMVATEAMEKMIRFLAPDDIWFLGDAVGKGPQSRETCDWVRANCRHFIGGNWDYGIGGREFSEDGYFWDQLGEERMAWLNSLPLEDELTVCGQRFRLFHGRPVTPLLVATTESTELEPLFETEKGRFQGVLFADSHRPFLPHAELRILHEQRKRGQFHGRSPGACPAHGKRGNALRPLLPGHFRAL